MSPPTNSQAAPRPRGATFSLLTLLLTTALLVTIVSHIWTSRNLAQLRKESYGLGVGLLDRFYVRRLPYASSDVWQWKAYVPPGKRYRINLATHEIGRENTPLPCRSDRIEFEGEVTINVIRHPIPSKTPFAKAVTVRITQNNVTRECFSEPLPQGSGMHLLQLPGIDKTDSFRSDQPFVLLRGCFNGFFGEPPTNNTRPAGEGMLIWIDQQPRLKDDL